MTFTKKIKCDNKGEKIRCEMEVKLQKIASSYGFTPKILNTYIEDNNFYIEMEDLGKNSLYDIYGDDPNDIPEHVWDKIRDILEILYKEEFIEYIDITSYNFMEKDGKIYIIDFGNAYFIEKGDEMNWFLEEFLDGLNDWNIDFK